MGLLLPMGGIILVVALVASLIIGGFALLLLALKHTLYAGVTTVGINFLGSRIRKGFVKNKK